MKEWSRSSFAAECDCLPVHTVLKNDTACPGDLQATPKIPNVPVEELERLVKDSASQQRHQKNLSSKGGFFRCKSSERSNDLRMSETESAKSIAELKTSNTISSEPHSAHARKVPNRVFCFFPSFFVSKFGSCGRAPARSCPRHNATHQHHSTSAQPLYQQEETNNDHSNKQQRSPTTNNKYTVTKKSNNTSHRYNSNNTQYHATTATTVPFSLRPRTHLSRIDARAFAQTRSRTAATTAAPKNNVTWTTTAWKLRRSIR